MTYTSNIEHKTWKHDDIIVFPSNQNPLNYDIVCKVIDSTLYELPDLNIVNPTEEWKAMRIDYKFISDGTWFIEGSECFPTHHVSEHGNSWGAVMVGWTNEILKDYRGEYPRWDGEVCSLDEFKIIKI